MIVDEIAVKNASLWVFWSNLLFMMLERIVQIL